jgi:hypothetical protein
MIARLPDSAHEQPAARLTRLTLTISLHNCIGKLEATSAKLPTEVKANLDFGTEQLCGDRGLWLRPSLLRPQAARRRRSKSCDPAGARGQRTRRRRQLHKEVG